MNIFVIPSWYPSRATPLGGIFVREQVAALATTFPEHNFIVSTWGHDDGELAFRDPCRLARALRWRLNPSRRQEREVDGFIEMFHPVLGWSQRLPGGGARRLVAANAMNLDASLHRIGGVDVMHAHVSYPAGYIASVLSKEYRIPYVLTEHMSPFPFPHLMRHGRPLDAIDSAMRGASAVIAVSPALARTIAAFGYPEPLVIPNLVDERIFYPAPLLPGKIVFLTLGGLVEQKGIDVLLKAIALWNPAASQVEFRIGGGGPLQSDLKKLATSLGVQDRVQWLGPVERLRAAQLFREAHAFVLPSRHETFGIVCAEAIASGRPVLATRCGGPEAIVERDNGILVNADDAAALAGGLQRLATTLASYNSDAIRRGFLERFSRRVVAERIVGVYRNAAHKP